MSVTVTCKRLANAFKNKAGETIYMLSEVTYESNVYPHTKHVHICCIGNLQHVIRKIFDFASDVEGGAVNSPSRKLTPEAYISSWIKAIKKPYAVESNALLNLGKSYSWNTEKLASLNATIASRGTEPTLINHYDSVEDIQAYFTVNGQFFDDGRPYNDVQAPELGYKPQKQYQQSDDPQLQWPIIRLPDEKSTPYFLKVNMDGTNASYPEWPYRIVGPYVAAFWPLELSHPGAYLTCIPQFRQSIVEKATIDPSKVLCTIPGDREDEWPHIVEQQNALVKKYGANFTLNQVDENDLYRLYGSHFAYQIIP